MAFPAAPPHFSFRPADPCRPSLTSGGSLRDPRAASDGVPLVAAGGALEEGDAKSRTGDDGCPAMLRLTDQHGLIRIRVESARWVSAGLFFVFPCGGVFVSFHFLPRRTDAAEPSLRVALRTRALVRRTWVPFYRTLLGPCREPGLRVQRHSDGIFLSSFLVLVHSTGNCLWPQPKRNSFSPLSPPGSNTAPTPTPNSIHLQLDDTIHGTSAPHTRAPLSTHTLPRLDC